MNTLMTGTVTFAGKDTRYCRKVFYEVVSNYFVFWGGMADSLSAGLSWTLWTAENQDTWVMSWSGVPIFGHFLGLLAQSYGIPHLLTLLTTGHYILLLATVFLLYFHRRLFGLLDSLHLSDGFRHHPLSSPLITLLRGFLQRRDETEKGYYDTGNLPLFSAACACRLREVGLLENQVGRHFYKICLITAPHVWLKVDLLAMSWAGSSLSAKFTLGVAILLQMSVNVSSTILVDIEIYQRRFNIHSFFPTWVNLMQILFHQFPLFVFVGCCWKLWGISTCQSHYISWECV